MCRLQAYSSLCQADAITVATAGGKKWLQGRAGLAAATCAAVQASLLVRCRLYHSSSRGTLAKAQPGVTEPHSLALARAAQSPLMLKLTLDAGISDLLKRAVLAWVGQNRREMAEICCCKVRP